MMERGWRNYSVKSGRTLRDYILYKTDKPEIITLLFEILNPHYKQYKDFSLKSSDHVASSELPN